MVAEHFGISPGYLSRLFKEYSPEGFSAYIKECKLEEAAGGSGRKNAIR